MKILVIEDDEAIRQTLQDVLELNGHEVVAASNGCDGVARAADQPDLILCDIGLPGMDGYEVMTRIRDEPAGREIPFIFLTARATRDEVRKGMAMGADDYVTKPFTEQEILDAINARIRRQQPMRERVEALMAERRREADAEWSHELLTPLNGVLGGLELIDAEADHLPPAELRELLAMIRAGAERQLALSRKLIRYFELERLKAQSRTGLGDCDARPTVEQASGEMARQAGRLADLALDVADARVAAPPAHLSAAISELVGNAMGFSQPGQRVEVEGVSAGARYRVSVVDQGVGMSEEECAQVGAFTQFGRKRYSQQGLGLGLAIARGVAEVYGGRLTLVPGTPRGIRAMLELPLG